MRSTSSLPKSGAPERPIFFRSMISPPLSLISPLIGETFPLLRRDVENLSARTRHRVFPQPLPQLLQTRADFLFDGGQFPSCEPGVVRPLFGKKVIFDFRFRARPAD